jgi:hypothetical protein
MKEMRIIIVEVISRKDGIKGTEGEEDLGMELFG